MAVQMTGTAAPVGIITADATALTSQHLDGVDAPHIPVVVHGLEDTQEFVSFILRGERHAMDMTSVEAEVLEAVWRLKSDAPDIRSMVLECTDLPPYAARHG